MVIRMNTPPDDQILIPALLIATFTVVLLMPFLGQAFNMDDTLFIRAAQQIAKNPFDFYGFQINWYGGMMPMSEVSQNPPLMSYLIASVAYFVGWSEVALHSAFLLSAVAATLGTWRLARSFCSHPVLAAMALAVTPTFLVSSTSLMCDTTMLALFVWGHVFWVQGLERDRWQPCLISALLISAAALTKYFAITAIPLLALLTLIRTHRLDPRLILLLLPVSVLFGFGIWSESLYSKNLFNNAIDYAGLHQDTTTGNYWQRLLVGLSFTGGSLAVFLFFSPLLFSRWVILAGGVCIVTIAVLLAATGCIGPIQLADGYHFNWGLILQLSLFILTGVAVLVHCIRDLFKNGNGDSLFLFCWVAGTFIFATFINWTCNARSLLPLAPAITILIIRRLPNTGQPNLRMFWPLLPASLLALSVTQANASFANQQRAAAHQIADKFATFEGTVWFQGHWGFQYYMEAMGAKPVEFAHPHFQKDDIMVVPKNNTNIRQPPPDFVLKEIIFEKSEGFIASMEPTVFHAGFHTDRWGPLPYSFGNVPDEEFRLFSVNKSIMMPPTAK